MSARLLVAMLRRPPWPALLAASAAGWIGLVLAGRALSIPEICSAIGWRGPDAGNLQAFWLVNSPARLLLSWLLMLLATMSPLLAPPIRSLRSRSLARRRMRAVVLFTAAYASVWTITGMLLAGTAIAIHGLAAGRATGALALAVAAAMVWQASPLRVQCLNRCHRLPRLSAFGVAADRDCLAFGAGHALWCGGVCWAAMLVPLCAGGLHLAAMALVAPFLWVERVRPARRTSWSFARRGGQKLRVRSSI